MIEIEKYQCNDGNEARTRERQWYEQLNASLNSFQPIRHDAEKSEYNIKYCAEYYINNKQLYLEKASKNLHVNVDQR